MDARPRAGRRTTGGEILAGDNELINSIDRALDILLLLQQEEREMGVTQISAALGIYKSTVHRTLATLEGKGFVQQNPDNGKYWLGIRLYSLGMLIRERLPLKNIAYPYAKELSEKFDEVVHLSILDKSALTYPKHILIGKSHTTINNHYIVTILNNGQIFSDLVQTTERNYFQFFNF